MIYSYQRRLHRGIMVMLGSDLFHTLGLSVFYRLLYGQ